MLKTTRAVFLFLLAGSLPLFSIAQDTDESPPIDELGKLISVYSLIKSGYVTSVNDKKLFSEAISGMLSSLDPHSRYLEKDDLEELESDTAGKYVGVGIETEADDGQLRVIAPIDHSPAERAGIRTGDVIMQIDGIPIRGLPMAQIARRIRGAPHTMVTLTIARKGDRKYRSATILREELQAQSVKAKMIRPGYLWVRISHFQQTTVDDLVRKINDIYLQDTSLSGLILDLRNNPGGLVSAAIGVAGAFLPKDAVIVTTRGRLPEANAVISAEPKYYMTNAGSDPLENLPTVIKNVPITVLVNGGSASASEIVAGALQDHKRATVMGMQTFGKGSIQVVKRISEFAGIKLTVATYYTPRGRSIQAKGITPDIQLKQNSGVGVPLREADLQRHIENDQASQGGGEREAVQAALDGPDAPDRESEFGSDSDFLLMEAISRLKGSAMQHSVSQVNVTNKVQ